MIPTAPAAAEPVLEPSRDTSLVDYGYEIESAAAALRPLIEANPALCAVYNPHWLAITLLEGDSDLENKVSQVPGGGDLLAQVETAAERVSTALGDDIDTVIADRRYSFIADLTRACVIRPASASYTRSDQIDRVVTHPWLGMPIFLVLMWLVFQMTANVSGVMVDWIDSVINGPLARWAAAILGAVGLGGSWVESLVIEGVLAGAGGVLAFVPVLMFLYFFIALLEDSGYMARAAFVMDGFMRRLGLHGKSFIPLLVGFGCSVPGIYATRTLEERRDRILTGLLVPFMSCAARLPIYVLIGTAFFGAQSGNLVFAMYLVGVLVAILSGLLFRRTLLHQDEQLPFVMELPPFRRPSFKTISQQVSERTAGFVRSVGKIIVITTVIVWALLNFPRQNGQPPALPDSLFGSLSRAIAPAFAPAGFDHWHASGSLVTGLVAKEVIVSTMSQVYGVAEVSADTGNSPSFAEDIQTIGGGFLTAVADTAKATISILPGINLMGAATAEDDTALQAALRDHFTALQAVAFSVFVLLYIPCTATMGALRQEFGTRWMWFSVFYMLGIAWLVAVLVYQGGRLLGWG